MLSRSLDSGYRLGMADGISGKDTRKRSARDPKRMRRSGSGSSSPRVARENSSRKATSSSRKRQKNNSSSAIPRTSVVRNIRSAERREEAKGNSRQSDTRRRRQKSLKQRQMQGGIGDFWSKRSVTQKLVIKLLMLALVLAGLFLVAHTIRSAISTMHENRQQPSVAEEFAPVPCRSSMLDISVQHSIQGAGHPAAFTINLKNSAGEKACHLDIGYKNMELRLWSGEQTIWDSQKCQVGEEKKIFLLDRGLTGKYTLNWDGYVHGAACERLYPAKPGTYKMQLYIGNEKAGGENSFFLGGAAGAVEEKATAEK